MKIGVLGGTFDPVHVGHLTIAEEIRVRLGLSQVIFVPAGLPWMKTDHEIASRVHRLEMVRLAIASNPCFEVLATEIEEPGPSYSVDTIEKLAEQLGPVTTLFFIVGPDALATISCWKDPSRLVRLCQIIAVTRPHTPQADLRVLESAIPGISARIRFIDVTQIDVSSTEIRRRVKAGVPIRYMVPRAVERYICKHKLYS